MNPFKSEKKASSQEGQVMTFIDYRNLVEELKSIGKNFPDEALKEIGRKYGNAIMPRVYISHIVSPEEIRRLGHAGYFIIVCPPVKLNGPDTVDTRIHEECQLFAENPNITTFVLVTNDKGDFRRTEDLLKNRHRNVVRFEVDDVDCVLKSTEGETVFLSDSQKEKWYEERNDFNEVIERLAKGDKESVDGNKIRFIKAIIEALQKVLDIDEMYPPHAKSFKQLRIFIWNLIHTHRAIKGFTSNDCHKVLDALLNHSDVLLQYSQDRIPRRYYVYNPKHTLPIY